MSARGAKDSDRRHPALCRKSSAIYLHYTQWTLILNGTQFLFFSVSFDITCSLLALVSSDDLRLIHTPVKVTDLSYVALLLWRLNTERSIRNRAHLRSPKIPTVRHPSCNPIYVNCEINVMLVRSVCEQSVSVTKDAPSSLGELAMA